MRNLSPRSLETVKISLLFGVPTSIDTFLIFPSRGPSIPAYAKEAQKIDQRIKRMSKKIRLYITYMIEEIV